MEYAKVKENYTFKAENVVVADSKRLDTRCIRGLTVLKDKRIAIMKSDTSIQIINPENFACEAKTEAQIKPTPFSKFKEGKLCTLENGNIASFFLTNEISVFSVENNKLTKVGSFNNDYFLKEWFYMTPLSKNRFATNINNIISIWKGDAPFQNEPLKEIDCGGDVLRFIKLYEKETIAVLLNNEIRLYSLEDYSLKETIPIDTKTTNGCGLVQFDDDNLIIGAGVFNLKDKIYKKIYSDSDSEKEHSLTRGVRLRGNKVLMTDSCYVSDSYRCECYYNYYIHVMDPTTNEYSTKMEQTILYLEVIDEHTLIRTEKDKAYIYKY